MRGFLAKLTTWVTNITSWWTLVAQVLGTGVFVWIGRQWEGLAQHGWPAVVTFAILSTSFVLTALSLGYIAISRFRQGRADGPVESQAAPATRDEEPPLTEERIRSFAAGLYVGEMAVSTSHLDSDLFFEVLARCLNATGEVISIDQVRHIGHLGNVGL